jgi:transposase
VAQVDIGAEQPGGTNEEDAEIKRLKAEDRRLREDDEIRCAATTFFVRDSTPQKMIIGFIDTMRGQGHAAING